MKKTKSQRWKMWRSIVDSRRCRSCKKMHGKIYAIEEKPDPNPPIHQRGRCTIELLDSLFAGTATEKGLRGADWWLKRYGHLPEYYIDKEEAEELGWIQWAGNLHEIAPGKMIFGGVYRNENGHLPSAAGRIWYEADIDYSWGWRGSKRILFSNDGLMFVSYDHYHTFVEIV